MTELKKVDESTFNFYEHIQRTTGYLETRELRDSSTVTYNGYALAGTTDEDEGWIVTMTVTAGSKTSTYVALDAKPQAIWEKKDEDGNIIASVKDYFDGGSVPLPDPIDAFYYTCYELPVDMPITTYITMPTIKGGTAPFTYSVVSNDPQLGLDTDENSIKYGGIYLADSHSGTVGDTYSITVKVTDANGVEATTDVVVSLVPDALEYNKTAVQGNSDMLISVPAIEGENYSKDAMSVAAYVLYTQTAGKQYLYSVGNADDGIMFGCYVENGTVYAEHSKDDGTLAAYSLGALPADVWKFIVVSRSSSAYSLFIDGSPAGAAPITDAVGATFLQATVGIGGRDHTFGSTDTRGLSWQGLIGQIGVSSTEILGSEVNILDGQFNRPFHFGFLGRKFTAFYKFDDDVFATAKDLCLGNDGLMLNLLSTDLVARGWFNRGHVTGNGSDKLIAKDVGDKGGVWEFLQTGHTYCSKHSVDTTVSAGLFYTVVQTDNNQGKIMLFSYADTTPPARLACRYISSWSDDTLSTYGNDLVDSNVITTWGNTYDGSKDISGTHTYKNGSLLSMANDYNTLTSDLLLTGTNYTMSICGYEGIKMQFTQYCVVFLNSPISEAEMTELSNIIAKDENIFNCSAVTRANVEYILRPYDDWDAATSVFKCPLTGKTLEGRGIITADIGRI